jgi:hypothetical protein
VSNRPPSRIDQLPWDRRASAAIPPPLREVCFLIDAEANVVWSDAGDSAVRLPDSRERWAAIWARRARIVEIAHSHPMGPRAFSREDETTMRALVTALGRAIVFSVVAPDGFVRRTEELADVQPRSELVVFEREPWWTSLLRLASGMKNEERTVTVTNHRHEKKE